MEINKVYQGDCLETMKSFPDNSIDSVITSPPYWQLRDYGWTGQWGLEPTFNQYLDNLISLMAEVKRVMKDTGTAWINLGDTYNANYRGGGEDNASSKQFGNKGTLSFMGKSGKANKCLLLLPHRFAIRCIDELGLILRNDIIWAKPNCMPESVTDRFSKKHEFFFFFAKNEKYYFDLDAVREKIKNPVLIRNKASEIYGRGSGSKQFSEGFRVWGKVDLGKNPGDVSDFWSITTKPSSEKHYATYNSQLIDKPIIAGCPEGGIILDPFAGTGTTLARAIQLNRQAIGIEGNPEYCKIAQERIKNELDQFKLAI